MKENGLTLKQQQQQQETDDILHKLLSILTTQMI